MLSHLDYGILNGHAVQPLPLSPSCDARVLPRGRESANTNTSIQLRRSHILLKLFKLVSQKSCMAHFDTINIQNSCGVEVKVWDPIERRWMRFVRQNFRTLRDAHMCLAMTGPMWSRDGTMRRNIARIRATYGASRACLQLTSGTGYSYFAMWWYDGQLHDY